MDYHISARRIIRDIVIFTLLAVGLAMAASTFAQEFKPRALTPQKTFEMALNDKNVLFVDVRDPIEIMFIGSAPATHVNIPFMFADPKEWNSKYGVFEMKQNQSFIEEISEELKKRGLDRDATIITMCRTGSSRGLPSAQFLMKNGFPNAYYVDHGFQGETLKDGPQKGMHLVNGWLNSGLPWTSKMNPDTIYRKR